MLMAMTAEVVQIRDKSESPMSESPMSESPMSESPVKDGQERVAEATGARGRSEQEQSGLATLSPSRASDFKTCPQLFKFRAIDRLPEPTTVYQARGTTAHLALERFYDLPESDREAETLFDLFRQAWTEVRGDDEYRELFPTAEDETAWGVESLQLLANYFAIEDPRNIDPVERELDMTEDLDGMVIRGILDRIDRDVDGGLIITDYKTGKAPPERYALPAFFALKIYALLIRRRTGETPKEVRLLYLNGPTMYRLEIDDKQLDGVDNQLRALWTAIERAMTSDRYPAKPGRLCDWCSFQDICPAFADQALQAS
jgi:putative RecB family exonuclease